MPIKGNSFFLLPIYINLLPHTSYFELVRLGGRRFSGNWNSRSVSWALCCEYHKFSCYPNNLVGIAFCWGFLSVPWTRNYVPSSRNTRKPFYEHSITLFSNINCTQVLQTKNPHPSFLHDSSLETVDVWQREIDSLYLVSCCSKIKW